MHTLYELNTDACSTHTKSVKESGFEMMIPIGKIYRKKVLKRIVQCDGSLIELQRFSHCRNEIGHERLITGNPKKEKSKTVRRLIEDSRELPEDPDDNGI